METLLTDCSSYRTLVHGDTILLLDGLLLQPYIDTWKYNSIHLPDGLLLQSYINTWKYNSPSLGTAPLTLH